VPAETALADAVAGGAVPGEAVPSGVVTSGVVPPGVVPGENRPGSTALGAAETVPAGAAMATLMAVAARTAWTIRCIAIGYVAVQVAIWHSFFAAHPLRLLGPIVAVACAAAVAVRLRRSQPARPPSRPGRWRPWPGGLRAAAGGRAVPSGERRPWPGGPRLAAGGRAVPSEERRPWPSGRRPSGRRPGELQPGDAGGSRSQPGWWRSAPDWRLAALDTVVVAALALGAWWCVPPAMQGDTSSWLYIAVVSQMIVPAWFAPTVVLIPLAALSAGAFWAGAARAAPAHLGASSPAAGAANVLATAAAAWCALALLRRRARTADTALAQADAQSRTEYVELTLSTERREHERLLHDTVLNTLTALGRGSGGLDGGGLAADLDQVAAARCQHDVTLIEHALGVAGDAVGPAGGDLLIAVQAVAAEMRARGLTVHVRRADDASPGPADPGPAVPSPASVAGPAVTTGPGWHVPDPVATALAFAVREALANVARHAGTAEAWVAVSPVPESGSGRDGVEVTVRDRGAGFDPAQVDPTRLGLRRSILERVSDWGGQATIQSAPGAGTVVTVTWRAPADPALAGPAVGGPAVGGPALSGAALSGAVLNDPASGDGPC
jgi:signal transduction histidine kinase